ncbi:restriction endonuclease [Desulforhopalus vacuolatus]|uniref:restriction endonuclease n=1 Tax=Desulforhopalus vacuolatus TaxID=40414 RepID=UPI001965AA99|nr:restriction endonuclease [Desulforhopalus vacuolatus]MBM9520551.1 restriction endonuclease [Desulforhopalus vacuolatus]
MARKRQSPFEDMIEITAAFPWWIDAVLAIVSYVGLHSIASKGMPQASLKDLSMVMQGGLLYTFASLGQYVLPCVFGIGALLSVIKRVTRKNLHGDVSAGKRHVTDITWQEFELLIGEHFRQQGFKVQETGPGPDGGVDLVLMKSGEKYLVQCKHYKAYKVGVKIVRELLGVMVSSGAAGGYVITSGEFTADAVKFSRENNIELINGSRLKKIMAERNMRSGNDLSARPQAATPTKRNPVCPKCGAKMVLRTAKKGKHAGEKFWGCSKFPQCRSILPYDES